MNDIDLIMKTARELAEPWKKVCKFQWVVIAILLGIITYLTTQGIDIELSADYNNLSSVDQDNNIK